MITVSTYLECCGAILYYRFIGIEVLTETITYLRGKCVQYLHDEEGNQTNAICLASNSDIVAMSVEVGQWHRLVSLESRTIILECKNSKYEPLADEDILHI